MSELERLEDLVVALWNGRHERNMTWEEVERTLVWRTDCTLEAAHDAVTDFLEHRELDD